MRETVEWLRAVEDRAAGLFARLADIFGDDKALSGFLKKLSEDESLHRRMMEDILSTARCDVAPPLAVDDSARRGVEEAFSSCETAIEKGLVTKENLFDHIIDIESSELNGVCLRVINTLKHCDRRFVPDAAKIHQHKASVERFLRSSPGSERCLKRLEALPDVWRERILIVDDEEFVAEALKAAVEYEGRADIAPNGREALRMIGARYYAAILVDVDMPCMGGLEFLERASQVFPGIEKRMLFFTESSNIESQELLRANNLRFLTKPDRVGEIRKSVAEILNGL